MTTTNRRIRIPMIDPTGHHLEVQVPLNQTREEWVQRLLGLGWRLASPEQGVRNA